MPENKKNPKFLKVDRDIPSNKQAGRALGGGAAECMRSDLEGDSTLVCESNPFSPGPSHLLLRRHRGRPTVRNPLHGGGTITAGALASAMLRQQRLTP